MNTFFRFIKAIFEPCHCGYCEPKTDADFLARLYHVTIFEADVMLQGAEAGNVRQLQRLAKLVGASPDKALEIAISRVRHARAAHE